MEPIPKNSNFHVEEERILRSIFPAEVWHMIFSKCDSNSVLSLNNSLQTFRKWLLPKRTAYLFPLVLIILKDDYLKLLLPASLNVNRFTRNHLRSIPSGSRSTVQHGLRATLKFRLVCKHWCKTINALHLEELCKEKLDIGRILLAQPVESLGPWMETKINANFNFENFAQMISKKIHFKKSNLIGRAIVIENWNDKIFKILEQIGHAVWHCTMVINSRNKEKYAVYLYVRYALKFLPNLKSLKIEDVEDFDYFRGVESLSTQQLLRVVNQNPTGKLENLQLLQTNFLPCPIFKELIRSNGHVKILVVDRSINCRKWKFNSTLEPSIKEVSFQISADSDLDMLLKPVDWKLTNLCFNVNTVSSTIPNRMFELLKETWKDTSITVRYFGQEWKGVGKDFCSDFLRW